MLLLSRQAQRPPIKLAPTDGNVGVALYGIIQALLVPQVGYYMQNKRESPAANTLMADIF